MGSPHFQLLLLVSCLVPPLTAQGAGLRSCDQTLLRMAAGANGYQPRDDRCEGLYGRQVAGSTIFLASFTAAFEDYSLDTRDSLLVSWPIAGDSGVQLRAETVRRGRYYRMDTQRPARDTAYRWSSRVLAAERIARRELGVVGWTRMSIGGSAQAVYLPVQVRQRGAGPACAGYELVLSPGERLTEVFLGLATIHPDGTPDRVLKQDSALGRGYYPAGTPIQVRLRRTEFPVAGLYILKVSATLPRGATTTRPYLLLITSDPRCPSAGPS